MKKIRSIFLSGLMLFTLINCGINDDNDSDDSTLKAQGNIQLSGDEASLLGNTLTVANIAVGNAALSGTDKSVILLSENITVKNNQLVYEDNQNGFVIVAADFSTGGSTNIDKTISMTVVRNGVEYPHACASPDQGFFTACGDEFGVDFSAKRVVFDNTTVINTDNDVILTMDGVVTWE